MNFHRISLVFVLALLFTFNCFASIWNAAHPYQQKIEFQNVSIKATPYDPYGGSSIYGLTEVFKNDSLLYSFDTYYRENIYTDTTAEIIAIVYPFSLNFLTIKEDGSFINTNVAIELLKRGQHFKTFTFQDLINKGLLPTNPSPEDWINRMDYDKFIEAKKDCKFYNRLYGSKVLFDMDTTQMEYEDLSSWSKACQVSCSKKIYRKFHDNRVYVKNNQLHIVTNTHAILNFDFKTLSFRKLSFSEVFQNRKDFSIPKLKRNYNKVEYADRNIFPLLKDKTSLKSVLSDFFRLHINDSSSIDTSYVSIWRIMIDDKGKCVEFIGNIDSFSGNNDPSPELQFLIAKLKEWIENKEFDTSLLPENFKFYSFNGSISFN